MIRQQGGSLPDEIATRFYHLMGLQHSRIRAFEEDIAALDEHKISLLIAEIKLTETAVGTTNDQMTDQSRRWNSERWDEYRVVGFDYETQRYLL